MKLLKKSLIGIGAFAVLFMLINAVSAKKNEVKEEKEPTSAAKVANDYNVYALSIPDNLDFAGEKMPLEDPDVYERMDRELLVNTYWQSNGLLMFKRAHKFFPIIEPILEEEGVPEDFKYLALIESGLENVTSPAGAKGFWQIMKAYGRENGLEINENIDERNNLEKATRAACAYFKKAKKRFGSWTLAAGSYHNGQFGISKELERQKANSYYDLLLGPNGRRYVFRIVALKEIVNNPKKYGFNFTEDDLYQPIPTYKIAVEEPIPNLAEWSKNKGINYKVLKIHNPWLRENKLNNRSGKLYYITLPKEGYYKQE
ncbi:lytic transglycosylase domain-containing protein [Spongiivirga citrea]|uniref:Transglycosylase SLT domain-containing protein n=1 Tax=Spongiivirga citrea TaxID=1481457 RepID=A0A6M0CXR6_9FLAO|nr:lytic transglycosylase domain-containing protein [Spongiivirga citrea]NER18480.1 transglycosylase SLT domain-containing protein [Spongiivirga citrea]